MCWRRIGGSNPIRFSRGPVTRVGGRWSDATSAGGRERDGQTVPELAADIGHAGRASKRASSKLRSSSCSPGTSPSASRR